MLPMVEVPPTIREMMVPYRGIFCRDAGFEHVSRYISGLILSPNKTLQGIYDIQIWDSNGYRPTRRAMHEAVFENGWDSDNLMGWHRTVISKDHQGKGREVISLDWTFGHHERGPCIYGTKKGYDYVDDRYCLHQTILTAVISNREVIDGIEVAVQLPGFEKQEKLYLNSTGKENYEEPEEVHTRILELLHYRKNRLEYRKHSKMFVEIVEQVENEGHFPTAHYAFDNGVLNIELTQCIESRGKHWVSELEKSRKIMWKGKWLRVENVDETLKKEHPESFRNCCAVCRNGEKKEYYVFTKVVRLKKYGKKRLVIVHESEDLSDPPRFLITDAKHWESVKILEVWSHRWSSEIFHEFGKQRVGLESAQVHNEESVKRHLRLSCVSQSFLQRTFADVSKSEKFEFAEGKATVGQRCRTIARESFTSMLTLVKRLFEEGKTVSWVTDMLMPV